MSNFSFDISFEQFAVQFKKTCNCTKKQINPSEHVESCPMHAIHKDWTARACAQWTLIRQIEAAKKKAREKHLVAVANGAVLS